VKEPRSLKSRDVGVFDLCVEDYEAKTGGDDSKRGGRRRREREPGIRFEEVEVEFRGPFRGGGKQG